MHNDDVAMPMHTMVADAAPGDAREAIRRELVQREYAPDRFTTDQHEIEIIFNIAESDFDEWLDRLNPAEARNLYEHLEAIGNEHRRRANTTAIMSDRIRERFSGTATYGLTKAATVGPNRN